MRKIILLSFLFSAVYVTSFSQSWNEMIKMVASDRDSNSLYGLHLSMDGNRAVVSSYADYEISAGITLVDAGAAYVLELQNGNWVETAKLTPSDLEDGDRFSGRANISGDKIIVGSFLKDELDISGTTTLVDAGAAYIFEYTGGTWTETAKLVASDRTTEDRFGLSVCISGDKAIVGAYLNDTDELGNNSLTDAGAAYVFEQVGGVWTETAKLVASDRETAGIFGYTMSMVDNKAIISAYKSGLDETGNNFLSNAGAAYVFEKIGGVWTETTKLVASDREDGDNFGSSIGMDTNKVIIGARNRDEPGKIKSGTAYIFEYNGGVWTQTAKLLSSDLAPLDEFGVSVDISGDKAIVGSRYNKLDASGANPITNAGASYIFEFDGSNWVQTSKLVASDRGGVDDRFGTSVGISENIVMVGSLQEDEDENGLDSLKNAGAVYVFNTCRDSSTVSISGITLTSNNNGAMYQWLDCDNGSAVISGENSQSFMPTTNGSYAVEITIGSCVYTSECYSITSVGVDNFIEENQNIYLYPNPSNSHIFLEGLKQKENFQIYNVLGEIVQEGVISNGVPVNIETLKSGVYFLKINNHESIKLIKN